MLTVLFVNHVGQVSGAEMTLRDLLAHLPVDIRAVVACPGRAAGNLAAMLEAIGVEWHEIPQWRPHRWPPWRVATDILRLSKAVRAVAEVAEAVRPDVIHANSLPAALLVHHAQLRPPMLWQARDLRIWPTAAAIAARAASRIVAISQAVARALSSSLPRLGGELTSKLRVIYNGIDLRRIEDVRAADLRGELGLPADTPLVGMVAQLVPWKRLDIFLKAAAFIAASSPAHFVVVGADLFREHGGYLARLSRLQKRLGLVERVHWLGYRADALSVLAALDVYLHTADAEPLGRSILEAMALGRPCVVPASAGPAEILAGGAGGMLFPPGDAQAAAGAVLRILGDEGMARAMAEAAVERVHNAFDAARMAGEYAQIYTELAG